MLHAPATSWLGQQTSINTNIVEAVGRYYTRPPNGVDLLALYSKTLRTRQRADAPSDCCLLGHGFQLHTGPTCFVVTTTDLSLLTAAVKSAKPVVLAKVSFEMGAKMSVLLLQVRGHGLVDVLEYGVHHRFRLALRRFEGLQDIHKRSAELLAVKTTVLVSWSCPFRRLKLRSRKVSISSDKHNAGRR